MPNADSPSSTAQTSKTVETDPLPIKKTPIKLTRSLRDAMYTVRDAIESVANSYRTDTTLSKSQESRQTHF
ncbi:hypothetical protein FBU59_000150 [Linderina macrospora]|uniref:Uncharacterized protein n=1 Tax=Linderina macrospora TaxID=4868 RepID=A0ACC1JI13_9FUNG|nr:hypothetical protein FBU59_000150 [Linderina macrospora]